MTRLTINTAALWTIEEEGGVFYLKSFGNVVAKKSTYAEVLEVLFIALEKAGVPMEFNSLKY